MPKRLTQAELIAKYGDPSKKSSRRRIVTLRLMTSDTLVDPLIKVRAHESVAHLLADHHNRICRLHNVWPREMQGENLRKVAGTDKWSLHSWALAWDCFGDTEHDRIDPLTNREIPPRSWFNSFQQTGVFFAGQNFKRPDPHHLECPY